MMRRILQVLGTLHLVTGIYIFAAPQRFYDLTPGLEMMGPFNVHFIRDVGLVFLASGGAMLFGALRDSRHAAISGAVWPALHGLFHLQIWLARGVPFDSVAGFNWSTVIVPGFLGLIAAWRFHPSLRSS